MKSLVHTPIRVLLADDHAMVREALRSLLHSQPGIEVVGEAKHGREAVQMAADLKPDVVVMDVSMPDLNGVEATRQIRAAVGKGPRVVALSAHSGPRLPAEMLRAGAAGYVMKDAAFEELTEALRSVMDDKVYLSPSVARGVAVTDATAGPDSDTSPFTRLSPREREILQLVAEGKAMKEVAHHLNISVKTVETHRKNVMEKLGIDNVAGLTKYALREGLTSLQHP